MVESFERTFLLRALREHDGNISRTAEAIGMVRQSLQQKIRELGSPLRGLEQRTIRDAGTRRGEHEYDQRTTRGLVRNDCDNLLRGIFGTFGSATGRARTPRRCTSRPSSERVRQYRELKEAVAGILYMRNKLETRDQRAARGDRAHAR